MLTAFVCVCIQARSEYVDYKINIYLSKYLCFCSFQLLIIKKYFVQTQCDDSDSSELDSSCFEPDSGLQVDGVKWGTARLENLLKTRGQFLL